MSKSLGSAIHSSISEAAAAVDVIEAQLWADRQFGISNNTSAMGTWGELFPLGIVSEENIGKKTMDIEFEVQKLSVAVGKVVKGMEGVEYTQGAGTGYGAVQAREVFVERWGRGGI